MKVERLTPAEKERLAQGTRTAAGRKRRLNDERKYRVWLRNQNQQGANKAAAAKPLSSE